MKLIWIATTSVLFVSLFVNAAEISTHHETDFLETDADSVLNSLQADDHDHRIEKRSGSRPVPGYSEKKGDCGGHDISNVKASLQQCAAKCSRMAQCKGFLYIHQAQNYRWHRCWLKRRLCSRPRHPRGQVVSVYTKGGKSGGGAGAKIEHTKNEPKNADSSSKKEPAKEGSKDGKFKQFKGYRGMSGGCTDRPFLALKIMQGECAARCTSVADCLGWVYYVRHIPNPNQPRCFLKRQMCNPEKLREFKGATTVSYYKTKGAGGKIEHTKNNAGAPKVKQVPGYTEKKGDCQGYDIVNVPAFPQECGAKCSKMQKCKGFVFVYKAEKGYPYHTCWLKTKLCSKPDQPTGQIVHVYTKKEHAGQKERNPEKNTMSESRVSAIKPGDMETGEKDENVPDASDGDTRKNLKDKILLYGCIAAAGLLLLLVVYCVCIQKKEGPKPIPPQLKPPPPPSDSD